jgi:hypothetical protein
MISQIKYWIFLRENDFSAMKRKFKSQTIKPGDFLEIIGA